MAEEETTVKSEAEIQGGDAEGIRDTDIVFDCPHCGKNHVIDYRGAGLPIDCSECGQQILVPIPEGMELTDLDMDVGEALKQLFATRRNYQRLEVQVQSLRDRLARIQEALDAMQEVVAEGLAQA